MEGNKGIRGKERKEEGREGGEEKNKIEIE